MPSGLRPIGRGRCGFYTDRLARWVASTHKSKWRSLTDSGNKPAARRMPGRPRRAWKWVRRDLHRQRYERPLEVRQQLASNWSSTGGTYTIFSANYLNWYHFHSETYFGTRIQIMKDVVKSVVDSNTNINIGLMRYDTRDYGTRRAAIKVAP